MRKLEFKITKTQNSAPTAMAPEIIKKIKEFAQKLNISTTGLTSGAGHDAAIMSTICPSGMIFVRSRNGLSHCPEEYTSKEDLEIGTQLLLNVVKNTAIL